MKGRKKLIILRFLVAISIMTALFWLNNIILWPITGIRYSINSETARLMRWTSHGYDSWGCDYSYGHQYQPDGTWKNLWHRPVWRHARWRNEIQRRKKKRIYKTNSNMLPAGEKKEVK